MLHPPISLNIIGQGVSGPVSGQIKAIQLVLDQPYNAMQYIWHVALCVNTVDEICFFLLICCTWEVLYSALYMACCMYIYTIATMHIIGMLHCV